MIRIDEIYENTFWPYIRARLPLTRMFFCDPPGRSDPDSLFNHGEDVTELYYAFFHDQEPVLLDVHRPLFEDVVRRNQDLDHCHGARKSAVIVSERDSDSVDQLYSLYGWRSFYYFFHGWAALDWYRGYDRSFLMTPPQERQIIRSFLSPNRIIGGLRQHRVILMYHLLRRGIQNAHISFPSTCPVEQQDVSTIASAHTAQYPDIETVFANAELPWNFEGEQGHPMHSCWLSLFAESQQSLAYVVTETVYHGRRHHITEKTFKPICLQMPFVLVSCAGSLEYLRSYGFRTFADLWDESYDQETNDTVRLEKIAGLLHDLDQQSPAELACLYKHALPMIQHNYQHFYGGTFEKILWRELECMLGQLQNYIQS